MVLEKILESPLDCKEIQPVHSAGDQPWDFFFFFYLFYFLTLQYCIGFAIHQYSEVSQKEKHQYSILTHIYGIWKDGNNNLVCETAKGTQMYRSLLDSVGEGGGA